MKDAVIPQVRLGRPPKNGVSRMTNRDRQNITIDKDLIMKIHEFQSKIANEIGFIPTLSQAIRVLIARGMEK